MAKYYVVKANYGHLSPTSYCEVGDVVKVPDDKKLPEKFFKRIPDEVESDVGYKTVPQAEKEQKSRSDMIAEAKERGLTRLGILSNTELEAMLDAKTPEDRQRIYDAAEKRIAERKK